MTNTIYGVESVVNKIATEVDKLISDGIISEEKDIYLYGLNKLSFAICTILKKRKFRLTAYLVEEEDIILQALRNQKDFSSKYLNSVEDLISIKKIEDFNKHNAIILIADTDYHIIKERLVNSDLSLKEFDDFYPVYDGKDDSFYKLIDKMECMDITQIKKTEVEILSYIKDFCEKYKLRWWVCGGSLLGTIRHKGFIPWDDDIDIFMPWDDYCKFLELFPKKGKYIVLKRDYNNPSKYTHYFSKIIDTDTIVRSNLQTYRKIEAVWVDVFPLVGLPEDEKERKKYFYTFHEYEKKMWEEFYSNDGKLSNFPYWFKLQDDLMGKYNFETSTYVGTPGSYHIENDYASRNVYEKTISMRFENIMVNVPEGYNEYLINLFGMNYMIPPDESSIEKRHVIEAYRVSK